MKFLQLLTTTAFTVALASSSATAAEIIATQTPESIGNGLKVYSLRLVDDSGNTVNTVRAVSGRASQQTPSDRAGSQTPLPFGVYRFDNPGSVINLGGEFGGAWSAITPTFSTERSGLGLHYDPSTFKDNGQAGTAGCLATPTIAERDIVSNFIRTYRPTRLTVNNEPLVPNNEPLAVNGEQLTVNNERAAVNSEEVVLNGKQETGFGQSSTINR